MKTDHQWDRHFKGGVLSALNIIRTYIALKIIFWLTGIELFATPFQQIAFLVLIDAMAAHNLYDGWEVLQFISFMQREMKALSAWLSFKIWIKEKGYDTLGDYIADHLGRLLGISIIALIVYISYNI